MIFFFFSVFWPLVCLSICKVDYIGQCICNNTAKTDLYADAILS